MRRTFVPDTPAHIFLEVDMSQIEGRIVYVRSGDPKLIALALKKPWEFDQHTENARGIFGQLATDKALFKEQRYLGKKVSHGAQRGLGGAKLAGEILKETEGRIVKSPDECSRYIAKYLAETGLEESYFPLVRKAILRDRALTNVWGRQWLVTHERMTEDLYRKGYSWWPQSDAGDLMNQRGVKPCMKWLARTPSLHAALNAQVHDSLLLSVLPGDAYDIAAFLQSHLETPMDYGHTRLSVPVEFKLGRTWAGDLEYKRLPDRATFTAAAWAVHQGGPALREVQAA